MADVSAALKEFQRLKKREKPRSTERIAGPLRALRDSGPSLRGARGFTPLSRLSPPLSHAIGSVIMLGIAYERDASVRRPDHPVNGREVDDLMAGSHAPAAANCEAGARSAGYRRMSPTCAPRGAFGMRSRAHDSTSLQEGTSRTCM